MENRPKKFLFDSGRLIALSAYDLPSPPIPPAGTPETASTGPPFDRSKHADCPCPERWGWAQRAEGERWSDSEAVSGSALCCLGGVAHIEVTSSENGGPGRSELAVQAGQIGLHRDWASHDCRIDDLSYAAAVRFI